jgi:hypothetical protein
MRNRKSDEADMLHVVASQFYLDFSQLALNTLELVPVELRAELKERMQEHASLYSGLDNFAEIEAARQKCPHCQAELMADWSCPRCSSSLEGLRKGEKWLIG